MKRSLLSILRCAKCLKSQWEATVLTEDEKEIRSGELKCTSCNNTFFIKNGVVDMLVDLPKEVIREKEHAEKFDYLETGSGENFPINQETVQKFKSAFLSLPQGDGGDLFRNGGSFENQVGNAERFYKSIEMLNLTGKERVLEVGASFCWGSWRFAQKGCEVVSTDVTNYLETADIFFEKDGSYMDRVMTDMSQLPFEDNSFDVIYSHSVIHHCKVLKPLFSEFQRVLKPGGRIVALHECSFGLFEDKAGTALQEAIDQGFNENAYTIPEWKKGALDGGFSKVKLHFFSFIEDYLYRKSRRTNKTTFKIALAKFVKAIAPLHWLVNQLSIFPRILLRPKNWMMIATK